jgi:hypothetical protein
VISPFIVSALALGLAVQPLQPEASSPETHSYVSAQRLHELCSGRALTAIGPAKISDDGFCFAYVIAIADLSPLQTALYKRAGTDLGFFCIPQTVPASDLVDAVAKWLAVDPKRRSGGAASAVATALAARWPCAPQ